MTHTQCVDTLVVPIVEAYRRLPDPVLLTFADGLLVFVNPRSRDAVRVLERGALRKTAFHDCPDARRRNHARDGPLVTGREVGGPRSSAPEKVATASRPS